MLKSSRRCSLARAIIIAISLSSQLGRVDAAGTTSAAFLRLGSGARASAMGDTFASIADDASATYWNPAGMTYMARREFMAEHTVHIQNIAVDRLSYVHPLGNSAAGHRSLGASATYLSLNGIEARTGNTADPDRTFGASDFYGALSYSQPLSKNNRFASSVGFTGKLIQQQIDNKKAQAYALDTGVMQNLGAVHVGATVSNIGSRVRFLEESYPLPMTFRLAASMKLPRAPLTTALGVEQVRGDSGLSFRMGMEYNAASVLSLRLGYVARSGSTQRALKGTALGNMSGSEIAGFTGMAAGAGFRLFGYALDYSFTPYGELGNAHRVSLSARF